MKKEANKQNAPSCRRRACVPTKSSAAPRRALSTCLSAYLPRRPVGCSTQRPGARPEASTKQSGQARIPFGFLWALQPAMDAATLAAGIEPSYTLGISSLVRCALERRRIYKRHISGISWKQVTKCLSKSTS